MALLALACLAAPLVGMRPAAAVTSPVVTQHPASVMVNAPGFAVLTSKVAGTATVQWERAVDGSTWTAIPGATAATYASSNNTTTTTYSAPIDASSDGFSYRAVFTNAGGSTASNAAIVSLAYMPVVTQQPVAATASVGDTVTFEAIASGTPTPTVKWESSTPRDKSWITITGATSPSYSRVVAAADSDRSFRATFKNSAGSVTTTAVTLKVLGPPTVLNTSSITPSSVAGSSMVLNASAIGGPRPIGQWEASTDGGVTWSDLPTVQVVSNPDETKATYSGIVGAAGTTTSYRARFTNEYGNATSKTTTITAGDLAVITSEPEARTLHAGDQTTFTVGFTSDLPVTVKWVIGTPGFSSVASFPADSNGTATVTVPVTWTGYLARAYITNAAGTAISGTSALLTVLSEPVPTRHPTGGTAGLGLVRVLTAEASASPAPTATWQRSFDGGATWSDYTAVASTMSESNKTYTTQLHADTSAPGTTQWRVRWANSEGSAYSNAATVRVPGPPLITVQPTSETRAVGETATFTVAGLGQTTVQWQRNSTGTYADISGATDLTYSFPVTSPDLGKGVRAVLTNADGTVTSRVVTVRLPGVVPVVSSQPVATAEVDGQVVTPLSCSFDPGATVCHRTRTATLSASAGLTADSARWQRSNDGGGTWTDIAGAATQVGSTSYTTPTAVPADDGARFRAVFTNATGETVSSSTLLTVLYSPVITEHPTSVTVGAGETAVFHAAFRGYGSLSWQSAEPGSSTWNPIPNSGGSTLTLNDVTASDDGRQFRAVAFDTLSYTGRLIPSQPATLTVETAPVVDPVVPLPVAREGDTVWLEFSAVGRPTLDVVFEASADGENWFEVPDAAVERDGDRTTVKVDIVADLANHGWVARARFSNARGAVTSGLQTLRVAAAGDSAPPVISCTPPAPSTAWRGTEVSATCTATDASPLADPAQAAFTVGTSVGAGGESPSAMTGPVSVCDLLGQCATSPSYGPFKVDRKAPTAPCVNAPAGWVKVNASVTCTPADGGSGSTSNSVFNLATTVAVGSWDGDASTASRVLCDKVGNCGTIRVDHLKVDRAGPDVTCAAPPATWFKDNISVACTAADPGAGYSGPGLVNAVTTQLPGKESADVQAKATVCDVLGNCTNKVVDGFRIDRKLPVVTCEQADGLWHTDNVVLPCEQTDDGSGLAPTSPNGGARGFTVATAVAPNNSSANVAARGGISCDLVGNCITPGVGGNKVDRKAPTVACPPADTAWHGDNITVTCTVSDIGSGPASPTLDLSTMIAAGDQSTAAATAKGTYCDVAGNCVQMVAPGRYKIDRKGPRVTVTAPQQAAVIVAGQPVTVAYTCTDDGSGPAACAGPVASGSTISEAAIGEHTFSVTGIDAVGNQTTTTVTWRTAAAVSGRVVDPSGSGVEGVTVSRYAATGTGPAIDSVLTDADGDWQFDQVTPGSYRFGAAKPGPFLPRFFGASTLAGAPAYAVDGAVPRIVPTLTMTPAAAIGGTVTSAATGQGLAGVQVAIYNNLIPTAAPIATVTTDANGNWQLGDLPAGTYRYRLTAPGHIVEWHTDAATKADSTGVVVVAGDQRTDLTDQLTASP